MPKKQTKSFFIVLGIIDLVLISSFIFMFSYMKAQVADTAEKEDTITSEIKQQDSVALMRRDIGNGKNYQDQLYGYILGKDDVVNFIKELETLATSSSLESHIQSVTYESAVKVTSIKAELTRFKMNVSGEWKNIIYFLKLLENYHLRINIEGLSMTKTASGKWSADFNFTVVKFKEI